VSIVNGSRDRSFEANTTSFSWVLLLIVWEVVANEDPAMHFLSWISTVPLNISCSIEMQLWIENSCVSLLTVSTSSDLCSSTEMQSLEAFGDSCAVVD
jgi:hypothetical protein